MGKIMFEKDGASTRFYLERNHPDYKQKIINQTIRANETEPIIIEIVTKNGLP